MILYTIYYHHHQHYIYCIPTLKRHEPKINSSSSNMVSLQQPIAEFFQWNEYLFSSPAKRILRPGRPCLLTTCRYGKLHPSLAFFLDICCLTIEETGSKMDWQPTKTSCARLGDIRIPKSNWKSATQKCKTMRFHESSVATWFRYMVLCSSIPWDFPAWSPSFFGKTTYVPGEIQVAHKLGNGLQGSPGSP